MKAEELVATIKEVVHDSAVQDVCSTLEAPSGRHPGKRITDLSQWYHSLSPIDRQRISDVVQHAVHSSVFGFLCVLDGVRSIQDGPDQGRLELAFTRGSDRQLLNDPEGEPLHDIYQSLVHSEVFGTD